jgi:PAS domain S-box-containing protein
MSQVQEPNVMLHPERHSDTRPGAAPALDTEAVKSPDQVMDLLGILEASTEYSMIAIDLEGRIVLWNEGARRLYGYEAEEVLGVSHARLYTDEANEHELPQQSMSVAVTDSKWEGVVQRLRKDGSAFTARVVLTPRRDGDGERTGFLIISNDISTEERQLKRGLELQQTNEDLERAGAVKDDKLVEKASDLEEVSAERQRLIVQLLSAQEEERGRIATAVHDDSIQAMAAVSMRLETLAGKLDDRHHGELDRLRRDAAEALQSLRALVFELEPTALHRQGLAVALETYCEHQGEDDLELAFEARTETEPDETTRVLLFRMAREAIVNAKKHARASRIEVLLSQGDGWLVRVRDDGAGFDPEKAMRVRLGHLGLASMRERLQTAGGTLAIDSIEGEGTTMEIWVPSLEAGGT